MLEEDASLSFPIHECRSRRRSRHGQSSCEKTHGIKNHRDEETAKKGNVDRIEYSLSTCQGWRIDQEDAYFYQNDFIHKYQDFREEKENGDCRVTMLKNHAIFGILDGHGGDYASKFVQKNFYSVFCKQSEYLAYCDLFVEVHPVDDDDIQEISHEKDSRTTQKLGRSMTKNRKNNAAIRKNIKKMTEEEFYTKSSQLLQLALEKTFLQVDCLMLISMKEMQDDLKKDAEPTEEWRATENGYDLMDAGTAILIICITPHLILCANAGDCRAVLLCRGNNFKNRINDKCTIKGRDAGIEMDDDFEVIPLSVDHKPYHHGLLWF
jgi:serine/threonine protein phosphatase PrpC